MLRPVLVLNFGSQYVQLIARRIRELGVYSQIVPFYEKVEKLLEKKPYAIILSGGPASVYMPKGSTTRRKTV
jgi:GMP synthase (glutamine-hydrolyzing) (EC 6.3.5.2)